MTQRTDPIVKEIRSMIFEHGENCVNYLEEKFGVLILVMSGPEEGLEIDVLDLPEVEV